MAETTYVCKTGSSNKFWSYDVNGLSVTFKWGRLGLAGQSKTQSFSSQRALDNAVQKKVAGKLKKGYQLTDKKELKQEKETARELGFRNKIQRMLWVDKRSGNKLAQLAKYNPRKYVYVEIIDSWSKAVTHLLLSKDESLEIVGLSESGKTLSYSRTRSARGDFVRGVRTVLRRLAQKVAEVTVKFAAVGARSIDLGDDESDWSDEEMESIVLEVGDDAASSQVITTFAAMGARTLEL